MLKRVVLRNFKSHKATEIAARPLTVLIGPNNSGKSSVFQSLLLWRQSIRRDQGQFCTGPSSGFAPSEVQPYLFAQDQILDVGEFDQILRRGEREVSIRVEGSLEPRKHLEYGPGPTDGEFEVRVRDNNLVYQTGRISYKIESLGMPGEFRWDWVWGQGPRRAAPPVVLRDINAVIELQPSQNFKLLDAVGVTWPPGPVAAEKQIAAQELMHAFTQSPRKILDSFHAVFPLRGFEQAGYPLAEPAETLDRMALADRTIALLSVLAYNRQIEQRLSAWLEKLVGISIEIKLLPGKRVTILTSPAKAEKDGSLFSSEGTGASQLPFILVPIGLTPPRETVLLSEPEVHLHPRAQSELASLFVQIAQKENKQFLIETHSEHILNALLHAVAKGDLGRDDLAIYYFESQDGVSNVRRLVVDDYGRVEGGLPGFFDQSLTELTEYLETLKKK